MIYAIFLLSLISFLILDGLKFSYVYFNANNLLTSTHKGRNSIGLFILFKIWLSHFFSQEKPNWIHSSTIKWKVAIIKGLAKFVGILCCISLIFCGLEYWSDHSNKPDLTNSTIFQIEVAQQQLKSYTGYLKFGTGINILISIMLIALSSVFPILEKYKVKDHYKAYSKFISTITYILVIATSFTFFGNAFEKGEQGKISKLEKHKLKIISGNKLLEKEVESEVRKKVVNEILSHPRIANLLQQHMQIADQARQIKNNSTFQQFAVQAGKALLGRLTISQAIYYQPTQGKSEYQEYIDHLIANNGTTGDDVKDNFQERNKAWYTQATQSQNRTKKAESIFNDIKQKEKSRFSSFYETYGGVMDEVIKAGYDQTGKEIINRLFNALGIDFVFFDQISDPIIHEPIQEFITKRTDNLMKDIFTGHEVEAQKEWNNISVDVHARFDESITSSISLKQLEHSINMQEHTIAQLDHITQEEIGRIRNEAENFVKGAAKKSRWESIRQAFAARYSNGTLPTQFRENQLELMKVVLSDWETYTQNHALNWYSSGTLDLEEQFYKYSFDKPMVKAAWGFILQQQDWDAAADYYVNELHLTNINGKPYNFLRYYYDKTGHKGEIDDRYEGVDEAVGVICPD